MKAMPRAALAAVLAGSLTMTVAQAPRAKPQPAVTPKFEVVAETKLLMEGLALPNYRGLETLLNSRPGDAETWTFVRGQALLIAETGNLLLLRPPRKEGRDTWYRRAMELRTAAAELARTAGGRDYARSHAAFADLTNVCNHCHRNFRVNVRVGPAEPPPGK